MAHMFDPGDVKTDAFTYLRASSCTPLLALTDASPIAKI